jgi:hypothetical protein
MLLSSGLLGGILRDDEEKTLSIEQRRELLAQNVDRRPYQRSVLEEI